jgi:hypothetical protein
MFAIATNTAFAHPAVNRHGNEAVCPVIGKQERGGRPDIGAGGSQAE